MSDSRPRSTTHHSTSERNATEAVGHSLVAVDQWILKDAPNDDIGRSETTKCRTRFWRCRYCGQERNRRVEFNNPCTVEKPSTLLDTGGYAVEESRTRRALTEDMAVHFGELGGQYLVDSERGATYEVDMEAWTCTCPDYVKRQPAGGCKHLRRVDLEIRVGNVPSPDGTFVKCLSSRPATWK